MATAKDDLHQEREKIVAEKRAAQLAGAESVFYTIWSKHPSFDFSFLGPPVEKVIAGFKARAEEEGDDDNFEVVEGSSPPGDLPIVPRFLLLRARCADGGRVAC